MGETREGLEFESSERVPERDVSISGKSSSEFSLHACCKAESKASASTAVALPGPCHNAMPLLGKWR
jgi:hypothetical protein